MIRSRASLKLHILLYEQRLHYCDSRAIIGFCLLCGQAGGAGWMPKYLSKSKHKNWGALDLHEWLFKRSSGLPKELLFCPENVVLLHHKCHMEHGQTKQMTLKCYPHKAKFYNIPVWVNGLKSKVGYEWVADYYRGINETLLY